MLKIWSSSRPRFNSLVFALVLVFLLQAPAASASLGGTEIKKNSFTVGFTFTLDGIANVCSGVLIAPKIIATAKHCVLSESEIPGEDYIFTNPGTEIDGPGTKAKIAKTVITDEDLAFIVLTKALTTDNFLKIASDKITSNLPQGANVNGYGYGAVFETAAPYSSFVRKYPLEWQLTKVKNTYELTSASASACVGDSGGPIVAQISKTEQVIVGLMTGAANVEGVCGTKGPDGLFRMRVVLIRPFLKLIPEYSYPKKLTITCIRGNSKKLVTGYDPKCPTGYRLRK